MRMCSTKYKWRELVHKNRHFNVPPMLPLFNMRCVQPLRRSHRRIFLRRNSALYTFYVGRNDHRAL